MKITTLITIITALTALTLTACSSNENSNDAALDSMFNPDAPEVDTNGEPGGDTVVIAGLFDGTTTANDVSDVVYWNLADNGVLTRYDYQQDGAIGASGENCYIAGDPITVTPEGGNEYSINNVAVTANRSDDAITITFNEADRHDLDGNNNVEETPTMTWSLLTTPVLNDLNACSTGEQVPTNNGSNAISLATPLATGQSDEPQTSIPEIDTPPPENESSSNDAPEANELLVIGADRRSMTRAECATNGGKVVGDIGNGAIHQPEFRCESGSAPIARISYLEGESIASEGEVCCV